MKQRKVRQPVGSRVRVPGLGSCWTVAMNMTDTQGRIAVRRIPQMRGKVQRRGDLTYRPYVLWVSSKGVRRV